MHKEYLPPPLVLASFLDLASCASTPHSCVTANPRARLSVRLLYGGRSLLDTRYSLKMSNNPCLGIVNGSTPAVDSSFTTVAPSRCIGRLSRFLLDLRLVAAGPHGTVSIFIAACGFTDSIIVDSILLFPRALFSSHQSDMNNNTLRFASALRRYRLLGLWFRCEVPFPAVGWEV